MIGFIDDHREVHGVAPICKVLPIAPWTYRAQAARRRDPAKLPARALRDAALMPEIERVFEENFRVYGVRKVWLQPKREGNDLPRCTVTRHGPAGRDPLQAGQDHDQRQGRTLPAGLRQPAVQGTAPKRAVGRRLHPCRDLVRGADFHYGTPTLTMEV